MSEVSPFRSDLLAGRVALITGGSSGIGLEIARQLGLHGAKVVISGRRQNVLNDACQDLEKDGVTAHGVQVRLMILMIAHIFSEALKTLHRSYEILFTEAHHCLKLLGRYLSPNP